LILYNALMVKSASYGWTQTDWSGGADTEITASHNDNQTGWTKFYSKDDNVDVTTTPGQATLQSAVGSTVTDTADDDFNAASTEGFFVVDSDEIRMWKCGDAFTYEGQDYDTLLIDTQCWFAENLNVGTYVASVNSVTHSDVSNNGVIEKYCYDNNTANCDTYGGLYDWDEAMGYVTTEGAQGICPDGWHIPTDAEQYALELYLTDEGQTCDGSRPGEGCSPAGTKLMAGGSSGFEALVGGMRLPKGSFTSIDLYGYYWSSTFYAGSLIRNRQLYYVWDTVCRSSRDRASGLLVRCIKD